MSELHPIQIWKRDKGLFQKLKSLRKYLKEGAEKYGSAKDGLQLFSMPVDYYLDQANSLEDIQLLVFKRDEASNFLMDFLQYWDDSRQMFAVDGSLAMALHNTDVGDVLWDAIKLPHEHFYLNWGDFGQDSFWSNEFEYVVDGVYVRKIASSSHVFPNDTLIFKFSCKLLWPSVRQAVESRKTAGFHFAEPIYEYALSGAGVETVGEAVTRGEKDYIGFCAKQDDEQFLRAKQLARTYGISSLGSSTISPNLEKYKRGADIIANHVSLVFNIIFYLTQQRGNRVEKFPISAPKGQVKKLSTVKNKEQAKSIRESLARKGYSTVVFVTDPEVNENTIGAPTGRELRSHWRRGHWRNHRYGSDLSLRKWIWIQPVLVKQGEPLSAGTLHRVEAES